MLSWTQVKENRDPFCEIGRAGNAVQHMSDVAALGFNVPLPPLGAGPALKLASSVDVVNGLVSGCEELGLSPQKWPN